jgi:hypothetical protein
VVILCQCVREIECEKLGDVKMMFSIRMDVKKRGREGKEEQDWGCYKMRAAQ